MSLSSFCVVTNALRLNLVQVYNGKKDKKIKQNGTYVPVVLEEKENDTMEKTMKIEGMMCGHCEARVKKCLEALPEVITAMVSHEAGTAVVTLNAELANDVLKKTIEDQDYTVLDIQ
jgi:Cu2+-exporting ATPase